MTPDDDERWLDLVAGRSTEDVSAVTRVEALLWRAAAMRWPPAVDRPQPIDAREIEALLARARADGLLPALGDARPSRPARWRDRLRRWMQPPRVAVSLALGVALIAVGPLFRGMHQRADEAVPLERAEPNAITVLRVVDPESAKARLIRDLGRAGVSVTGYTRFGRAGVDADLPDPLTPPVEAVLRSQGLPAPADHVLRVEFERVAP